MSAFFRKRDPYPAWQNVAIVAWTGMRGVVSLAAALAVPLTLSDGSPFPGRDYIFFITFCVILATLVLQGLSLPGLIRRLGVVDDGLETMEERTARLKANEAAVAYLAEVDSQFPPDTTRSRCPRLHIHCWEAADQGRGGVAALGSIRILDVPVRSCHARFPSRSKTRKRPDQNASRFMAK